MSIRNFSSIVRSAALFVLVLLLGIPAATFRAASAAPVAPDVKLVIGKTSVMTGSQTTIPVSVNTEKAIASYNVQIDYDPKAIEIVKVTPKYGSADDTKCLTDEKGCIRTSYDNEAGWLRAAWIDPSTGSAAEHPIASEQTLFEIKVQAKNLTGNQALSVDAASAENLSFTGSAFEGSKANALTVSVEAGQLSVNSPVSAEPASELKVYIDGQAQPKSATVTRAEANGRKVATIAVDNEAVTSRIESNQTKTLLLDARGDASGVIKSMLNGKLVKAMESKEAVLAIETDKGGYTLPASQVRIDDIASQIGKDVALQDIEISVRIADPDESELGKLEQAAQSAGATQVGKPVSFEVEASYGGQVINVNKFSSYVERTVALPDGVDPSRITTGVVLNADGTVSHVPTVVTQKDGKYYAAIHSLTNSVYAVIWHPKAFADVAAHWSRNDVNDLASRLIIKGATDTAFAPNRGVTRAEFVSILSRGLGLHVPQGTEAAAAYTDVPSGSWYEDAVRITASYGIAGGYDDGTFKPGAPITRQEAMAMLARAMKLAGLASGSGRSTNDTLAGFADAGDIGAWAKDAVASVVDGGLAQGNQGKLDPGAGITRAETAAMARRLLVKAGYIDGTL
ncbi:S-layer homology domain-containing protein [Cohnella sp. OV330]|uniref:S-layer homology domain-containing protein n=1 Tax=Cohnella sp. OV330 TaxID=1855288 RepID=UPI0008EE5A3E|nr:S-layer homology domain-containing protein [Cohnella sp. OV330]SFA77592.1 S-layer homology domain-containing protein [Cohnella sp. OV330]